VPQDQQTIQAGIGAADHGDTVLVAPGRYRERIRLKPRIIVKSAGDDAKGKLGLKRAEATIIDGSAEGAEGPGVTMAEDATLDGFTVTGVGKYDDALWKKHYATQGEHQSHEHIGAPGTAGISVIGVSRATVANNIVHHIGYTGIAIIGANGKRVAPHIVGNVAYRNMGGGIGSMRESTATIEQNVCFENFYAGIGHNNASPLVKHNVCYANIRAGIGISEHSKPIVQDNRCFKNRRAGIGVRTGKETTPMVERNECYENDMAGIGARDNAAPTIRHNRCYKNAMAGIGCRTGARPLIEFNRCFENKMTGIGVRGDANATVRGNHCTKNKLAGIGVEQGGRATITENECRENVQAGIGVREKSSALIVENKCIENKQVAIGVLGCSTAHIARNVLERTRGMPPMIVIRAKSSAVVADNVVRGGGVAGVMVEGAAQITGNHFYGNGPRGGLGPPNFAAWVQGGSTVSFCDNRCDGWRHALFASGARRVRAMDNTTSRFLGATIVIAKSQLPAHVVSNVALSDNEKDEVMRVSGPRGVVVDNQRKSPPPKKAAGSDKAPSPQ